MSFSEDDKVQQKLTRVRPPRVKITYDVETGGAMRAVELPFIVGIFANLAGDAGGPNMPAPYKQRQLIEIDRDNIHDVMKASGASVDLSKVALPPETPDGTPKRDATILTFGTLGDFAPIAVVRRVPRLSMRNDARARVRGLQARAEIDDVLASVLNRICASDQAALRAAIVARYREGADANAYSEPDRWAALDIKPEATAALVAADALTADDVLAQLLGRLVITQPAADGDAAPAEASAVPPDWQDARVTIGHFSNAVLSVFDADIAKTSKQAAQWIDGAVVSIDEYLSANIDAILHAPSFQKLEATWRGLSGLVANSETGAMLKLKVFNTRREELQNDLENAVEFDQSTMFKLIYEAEYGTYGGNPYSTLLIDYPISNSAADMEFLGKLTQVAAAAHAPLLAGVDASMFGLKDFSQLAKPRDLQKIFEGSAWIPFNEFRQTEDSRYATLVLPRLLLRLPYDYTVSPVGFNYIEDISSDQHRPSTDPGNPKADEVGAKTVNIDSDAQFLWGNPAYALAQRITTAFSLYGWTAAIRGEEGGGLVDGLPLYQYRTDRGSDVLFCPTEVAITDRREKELSDLGFIALCHCKGSSRAVFFGGQTVNQPIKYLSDEANANAELSARLPYMLAASRFAHYVKVIIRKKLGGFMTRVNVEALLNNWIAQYVLLDDNANQEVKASYPLRSAQIVVTEVPGSPGSYKATMFLKPHFQLEELTASIRLVADLPA
ncbi:type VI secretion system contractile sheath large subunit [Paraburkholderia humisilvae]|uniref:TssC1 N-terminal domain-containing protein n=1 Tax=Paraburkholderia humisilvae TaxID=627669 RepID=A0A6J5F8I8_9BURK|nr:type VI secretion system contractile sheath large subunit [Paraburkholderia humisilvae]CAB3773952.1 hypothetical protein LMG29542_07532 [Paraburkholderia humisilvae]